MAGCSLSPCFSWFYSSPSKVRASNRVHSTLDPDASSRKDLGCRRSRYCPYCDRRHFLGAVVGTGLLPVLRTSASDEGLVDPVAVMNRIHPRRPDWYSEFYASAMDKMMEPYEAVIAGYKSQLFANLKGKSENILEIGVGTGPNFRYYAESSGVKVVGADPNQKMEKYARSAAEMAGLRPSDFRFIQAVAEALPLNDATFDAVIGTLVLCSVKDVNRALCEVKRVLKPGGVYVFVEHVTANEGTILKAVQQILDPLQQIVADGCHLTRNTASNIAGAGFSSYVVNEAYLSNFSIISPHIYGIAYR